MPGRPWTLEETAALRDAVAEGATCSECADELGRTYYATVRKLSALRLRTRRGRPRDVRREMTIVALVGSGLSVCAAARQMGLTHGALFRAVYRLVTLGVLVRTGGATNACRFRVTTAWKKASGRAGGKKHFDGQLRSSAGRFGVLSA
jgi:hypothetical protein